jgi:protocatechuate 3,4-dioxygenase beta subunit
MRSLFYLLVTAICFSCNQQPAQQSTQSSAQNQGNKSVGGGCDGCELIYEGMPDTLGWIDTLPDWHETGQRMEVSGTVYRGNGKTPAPGVTLYFYHTDSKGYYSVDSNQAVGIRHGHIRGWVKTNAFGQYKIYTTMPASYPGATIPAHIHAILKEPKVNEYYIDEIEFTGDPLLTESMELKREKRGGSGIVKVDRDEKGLLLCHRDIILGLNIPGYP